MNDVEIALISLSDIFSRKDPKAAAWVIRNTRRTNDSVRESCGNVRLSPKEAACLEDKLDRLRARLKLLGECV